MTGETKEAEEKMQHDISASAIKTFNRCPKQYELSYERDLPGEDINQWNVVGSLVHDSLEEILKNGEHTEFTNKNRLARHLKREFYDREETDEYDMAIVDDSLREDGLKCMDNAAAYLTQRNPQIRDVEKQSYFKLNELKVTALAYMDVCTQNELWDWKTGSLPDGDKEKEQALEIQGSFYMGAYHKEYGELPEKIRFIYLKEGEVRSFDASKENWDRMFQHARRVVNAQRKGQFRADPSRDKCYWCAYSNYCTADPTSIAQLQQEIDDGSTEMWEAI